MKRKNNQITLNPHSEQKILLVIQWSNAILESDQFSILNQLKSIFEKYFLKYGL